MWGYFGLSKGLGVSTGFLKNAVPGLGVHIIRIITFWGLLQRVPHFYENRHVQAIVFLSC